LSHDEGTADQTGETPDISAARSRLDRAVLGFNRHAILVEHYRSDVEWFRASRQAFEAGARERAALRDARANAALHRALIRNAVGDFVRLMRDAGMPPEVVLVAVKRRFTLSVTAATPGAPAIDASLLESDAGVWAIKAYYDAA
jgi:hypothetical protein